MRISLLLAASAAALLAGCGKETASAPAAPTPPPAKVALGTFGIDTAQMDTTVKPGDDFYKYVNGKWLASAKMPADKARYGSFDALRDKSDDDVHTLLEDLKANPPSDVTLKKVADLYAAWMDPDAIEQRGIEPLKPYLDRIAAIKTRADLMKFGGDIDFSSPFGLGIQPDPADTTKYAVFLGQAGLGMGRDYYLNKGEKFDAYRAAYKTYITTILKLIGDPTPEKSAQEVFDLETKLAKVQWSPERQRDVKATYNPMDRAGLKKLAPDVDWPVVLASAGLGDVQNIVVGETTAITDGGKLWDTAPIDTWKKYLAFHVASDSANALPKAFDDANFDFYSKTMRGIEQQRDRWKRGVTLVDGAIGEGLGQAYVAKYFPPENKEKMDALVKNLLAALKTRIENLDWMDDATRAEALKKLATFDPRIGYPDKWRDYSALTIEPGKLFEDVRAAHKFEWDRQVNRLSQPVDREEWYMTPPTVNAYYDPLMNQITFPAAILQPPFFDPLADPAVNYGAIGAVIGHEIGHGFDDQGRQFDEHGKIRNWWTDETAKKFKAATDALAAQYHAYCPLPPDGCVNGYLTMGENIGDLGGMQMAYTAYHMSLDGKEAPVIDGFTGDQRFFMAWAQVWRAMSRDDALRNLMLTNPHAPDQVRGQNPERNVDAWYAAFNVKEGDKMYLPPDKRVHIW
ncbi:MAG: M13 family peptidase [Alphaproteobacteria bacterium]|nr:M13 family peptidase [Alphaproteobacteria bacterium]